MDSFLCVVISIVSVFFKCWLEIFGSGIILVVMFVILSCCHDDEDDVPKGSVDRCRTDDNLKVQISVLHSKPSGGRPLNGGMHWPILSSDGTGRQ